MSDLLPSAIRAASLPDAGALLRVIGGDFDLGEVAALAGDIEAGLTVAEPTALARATSLWAWKHIFERKHGHSRGGDRKSLAYKGKNQNENFSFCSVVGARLGLSERAIQLDVRLAEDLGPADIATLWSTKHADNGLALRFIAALDRWRRDALFAVIKERPSAAFQAVLVEARLRAEVDSDEAKFLRFVDLWSRSGAKLKRRILAHQGVDQSEIERLVNPRSHKAE